MGSRAHCSFPFPFLSQETLFYNPDLFHLAYIIQLAFKLRNMEKTWGKNGGTKNVTTDCSSSTFTAQTDTLFKTLTGENMVTTLSQQHIPIYNGGQKNLEL